MEIASQVLFGRCVTQSLASVLKTVWDDTATSYRPLGTPALWPTPLLSRDISSPSD